jgi:hypothetical protein
MATWKKLVVSGSDISQLNNDAGYISASQVPSAAPSFQSASFNGIDLIADSPSGSLNFASGSTGLNIVATAGTDTLTFDLVAVPNSSLANDSVLISGSGISAASVSLGNTASIDVQVDDSTIEISADSLQVKDGGVTNVKLANDGITFGTADVSLGDTVTQLSLTGFTGSFTGSLADGTTAVTQTQGDNSTKVATTAYVDAVATAADLDLSGDGGTTTSVDLDSQTLAFSGADGIEASASAQALTVGIADGGIANAKLANDSITIGAHEVNLGESVTLEETGFNSGSFSGSFEGDGSGLTGIATNLDVSGSDGSGISIDLKTEDLTIGGTANEIETTTSGQTVTIGLPDDVTITQDLTVNRNLTVVGTASFQHETNLEVSDRFIRMASGSSAAGDGGIVIQQSADGLGEVFGFENSVSRWAVSSSFDGGDSTFNAEAYMAAVLEGSADTATAIASAVPDAKYNAKGNIWISDSENIWIYS